MAKTKEVKDEAVELKRLVSEEKAILGSERVIKALQSKKLVKVYLAKNCPAKQKEDILYYGKLSSTPIVELDLTNEEIGIICKRNYLVAVIGII